MASAGEFPKIDGDIWFASNVNSFFDVYGDAESYNLAVTTTTAALDFSGVSNKYAMLVRNIGYQDCYITLTNTATTGGMFLPAGAELKIDNCNFNDLSAITASGATTLSVAVFTSVATTDGYRDESQILTLSATDATSNISFTNTTAYKSIMIINTGASGAYINFGATASTSDFRLEPRETFTITTNESQISAICDATETATVRIIGVY